MCQCAAGALSCAPSHGQSQPCPCAAPSAVHLLAWPAEVDLHPAGLVHQLPVEDPGQVGEAVPGIAGEADPGTAAEELVPGIVEAVVPGTVEAVGPGIVEEVGPGIAEEVAGPGTVVGAVPGIVEEAAPGTVEAELVPGIAAAVDTAVGSRQGGSFAAP